MTTIPKLTKIPGLTPEVSRFLDALKQKGFKGDVQTDYATRLINATDNSVYQIIPQAVVAPKSAADVEVLASLLGQEEHRSVTVSPRGGGTGTNGQALHPGVIVDLSRHMNRIIELDKEAGWVRVQPGVVLDQLNAYLKPHGLFFAPSVSPSSRATLGGMIATDACGKGSRVYGKTSGHVVELSLVLPDGTTWVSHELSEVELSVQKGRADRIGEVLRVVDDIVTEKKVLIEEQFPKIPRFLTGYNLAHVRKENAPFTLNPIVSGAEGTLAFVTEAKLRVLPIPLHRSLIAIRYATFDDALRAAEVLVATDPGAIETIDDTIVELAKKDAIWDKVSHLLQDEGPIPTAAINLVEFSGDSLDQVSAKMSDLASVLAGKQGEPGEAIGYKIAATPSDIAALWELRKKGVGLLGNAPGERRPIAFVEDTAVHPKDLAPFIREFRAILDGHGLTYGMFGHVDAGCLHVRPALNTRDPADEQLLREISDKVVALVRKYGGVMWSEHGKGFRSEYSPQFFGEELFGDLCKIKRAFDPHNQLNPGKLAVPAESGAKLVSVDALKRGEFDRIIAPKSLVRYATSVNCNGNGACFDYAADSVMCPSSKVTRDRIHSPKGRAGLMREWLRQLSEEGFDAAAQIETGKGNVGLPNLPPSPLGKDLAAVDPTYDFSHEVYTAMDGCLACKACATQCPVKVDVPELKSEFLHLYHQRYPRPVKDLFAAALEFIVVWMAWVPRLVNMVLGWRWVKTLMAKVVGIVDAPRMAKVSLKAGLLARKAPAFDFERLERLTDEERDKSVILIQDAFHGFYDTHVTLAAYDLMTKLGFTVYVAPYRPSGKALHVKGFLDAFKKTALGNIEYFRKVASYQVPMVCIDPAVTLLFRDEYAHVVKEPLNYRIYLFQEWLSERSDSITRLLAGNAEQARDTLNTGTAFHYVLMGHCTERTAAPATQRQWVDLFERFGVQLKLESVGCCGMCGMYGHEAAHYNESRGIFAMSWERHLPDDPKNLSRYLATGYSCRSQVKRFSASHRTLKHPVEVMLQLSNI